MPDSVVPTTPEDDPLDAVIAIYLQQVEAGAVPDRDALINAHPELADRLRAFFADFDRLDRQAGELRLSSDPNRTSDASGPAGDLPRVQYFGDYELLEVIAQGGMGIVYKARQVSLNRVVALKMILKGELAGPRDVDRFHAEAIAAGNLDHPNIVPIYEVGEHEGQQYYSMRFVEGASLAGLPRAGDRIEVQFVGTVARAVHHAHQRGILHRDLKPSNILIDSNGTPLVTDFGLAKRLTGDTSVGEITISGALVGTPRYMAPEQAASQRDLSVAVDVYSLGVVLYERLTGRTPFAGESMLEVLRQVRESEPPRPSSFVPRFDRDLETICLKCLEKDPAKRYGSAEELAGDLDRWLRDEPILARPAGRMERLLKWTRRRPAAAAVAVVSVLSLAVLLGVITTFNWSLRQINLSLHNQVRETREARDEADDKAKKLEEKTYDLNHALLTSKRLLVGNNIQLAANSLREGRVSLARDLLDDVPANDKRLWDWRYLKLRAEGSLFTLYGHTREVTSLAFSRDGRRLASGSADGTVKVWDTRTGKPLTTLYGHTGGVTSVAFSPDGVHLASGSQDQTVRVWDTRVGQELGKYKRHAVPVTSVAYSPDGASLASASQDGAVTISDAHTGQELLTIHGHLSGVTFIAFSPDGHCLASSSLDQTVKLWDAHTGRELFVFTKHTAPVMNLAFSPDGACLASSSGGAESVRVWNAHTGQELPAFTGANLAGSSVAFRPDGAALASGSADGTMKVWDINKGQVLLTLYGHTAGITSEAFSPDGNFLASSSMDQTIKLWDARTGQELFTLKGHTASVTCLAFSLDGTRLASGSDDRTVKIWDARTGEELITVSTEEVSSVAFSPDTARLASGGGDTVKVWDAGTGQEILTLKGHNANVRSIQFSPDGGRLACGAVGQPIKVWDSRTGEELLTIENTFGVHSVSFSPDGTRLASGGIGQPVRLWDARTGEELLSLQGHTNPVTSVAFSPDGARLASGSADTTVKVWDARTGLELLTLKSYSELVCSVAFSPDGARLASGGLLQVSGSEDESVRVWDSRTGQELLTLKWNDSSVNSVAFSPDGTRLACGRGDATVKIWDARTSQDYLALRGHTGDVTSVAFSPDGIRLASGDVFGKVVVWDACTGQKLLNLSGHTHEVTGLTFSADGASLVSTDQTGMQIATDVRTGQRLDTFSVLPARPNPALSPDGHTLASRDRSIIRLIDLRLSNDELHYRRRATSPDPEWHAAEAEKFKRAGNWFAAEFHLQQRLRLFPVGLGLRRELALCQLAAGQETKYRRTCANLVDQFDEDIARDRIGLALLAPWPSGVFATLPSLALAAMLKDALRPAVARAVALGPHSIEAGRLLSLAPGVDIVTRALLLHRAGKHDDAVKLLADQSGQRAQLIRALAEQARGSTGKAAQALARAVRMPATELRWDEHLELELLKNEAEALLKPASGK